MVSQPMHKSLILGRSGMEELPRTFGSSHYCKNLLLCFISYPFFVSDRLINQECADLHISFFYQLNLSNNMAFTSAICSFITGRVFVSL